MDRLIMGEGGTWRFHLFNFSSFHSICTVHITGHQELRVVVYQRKKA